MGGWLASGVLLSVTIAQAQRAPLRRVAIAPNPTQEAA